MSIFSTSRIRFSELYEDSINFLKSTYTEVGQYFTMGSPMGQLLQVILNLGRMILFYIEDSTTELNIKTATRPQSILGLTSLTGHNPSRAIAARGTLRFTYNGQKLDTYSSIVAIPNYSQLVNNQNGLTYTVILSGEELRIDLTSKNNYVDVNVVQGTIEYQQATGTGDPLQSFNFQTKKGANVDNYFVNVYVDGKLWPKVDSILDMVFDQEAVMIKTGQTGGFDIFFGTGYNGKVSRMGSVILVEYLITDGEAGNITSIDSNTKNTWKFATPGFAINSVEIDLNKILTVSIKNDIIFGTLSEPIYLTRLLGPHTSRSFVLANTTNYIYFLRKLNIFTVIDAIPGFATFEDQYVLDKYNQAQATYESTNTEYLQLSATYGVNSTKAIAKKTELDNVQKQVYYYQNLMNEQKKDDNTVYLFLVPDVNKRITSGENYYTCSMNAFQMSANEKTAILDLIEESGQRILTIDNAILNLQYPRFTINMSLILWEGTIYDNVRQDIVSKTSEYFLRNTRRDRIPVSDLVKLIEGINGVDSVNIWFDASKDNLAIYKTHYGIDDYGDIILERFVKDAFGNNVSIKDVYPLIRGGFENASGTYYEDNLTKNVLSSVNIQVRGVTRKDINSEHNIAIVNSL